MRTERFVRNLASTTVIHGGTKKTASGTIETLTVSESDGVFPSIIPGVEQFHFKDRDPSASSEIFRCIATDGDHWQVIRGAEGSEPVPHQMKFTIRQVITSEFFQRLGSGSTTELCNAVTVCGADPTGEKLSDYPLAEALESGPVYLPSGVYSISNPINVLPGQILISFGHAVISPTDDFFGDSAIELVDGSAATRIENISINGSNLGAGTDIYGIFAETQHLEAELRGIRISGFPNSGIIASGNGWMLDRVTCSRNFGSGFELNVSESLLLGCRAFGNSRYGFIGSYQGQLIGCLAKDNRLGDLR